MKVKTQVKSGSSYAVGRYFNYTTIICPTQK